MSFAPLLSPSASAPAPQQEKDQIPPCVCLSECVLGGLIANAERYGRFGFVFLKTQLLPAGGPCPTIFNEEEYAVIDQDFSTSDDPVRRRIFGRSNLLSPVGTGKKIQDFSHEREWRVFSDILFDDPSPIPSRTQTLPTRRRGDSSEQCIPNSA